MNSGCQFGKGLVSYLALTYERCEGAHLDRWPYVHAYSGTKGVFSYARAERRRNRYGRCGEGGKPSSSGLAAEQLREARESSQAKNAEASTRDRMVEIGRGNQQAGRQRAK